jgi:WD40 repeat protein
VGRPVATVDDAGLNWWWYGFSGRGDHAWFVQRKDGTHRLLVWPIEAGASSEPRVFSMPNPDGNYLPSWEAAGSRLAWGSSADRAVWVWDLAGPPDAAPVVLRRPDTGNTKQALFSPRDDWLVVANSTTLTFWSFARRQARLLTGHRQDVSRLVFTRDSRSLVSCGEDDVRLWPLGPGRGGARRIATHYEGGCLDAALSLDGEQLLLVGYLGAWVAPSFGAQGRWLWRGGTADSDAPYMATATAWDASGRRVAVASGYTTSVPNAIGLFDLETGKERRISLAPSGETGLGYDWGVWCLAFAPEGRLLAGGSGGVRWIDPETGAAEWIWRLPKEAVARFALSADGRRLVAASTGQTTRTDRELVFVDLSRGEHHAIRSHDAAVTAVGIDRPGHVMVSGDEQGVVRVGPADGSEPHRLCCHAGPVNSVAVSPDGQWIASAAGSEIRLWPMPDVTKPPLHTLPYDELMAKLHALTNLQVVEDAASPTGYKLDIGPFPGWKDVPTW